MIELIQNIVRLLVGKLFPQLEGFLPYIEFALVALADRIQTTEQAEKAAEVVAEYLEQYQKLLEANGGELAVSAKAQIFYELSHKLDQVIGLEGA